MTSSSSQAPPGAPPGSPPLGPALEAELSTLTPQGVRSPRREWWTVVLVGLAVIGGLWAITHVRADLEELSAAWMAVMIVLWALGFAVPLHLALVPPRGQVIPRWRLAGVTGGAAAAILVGLGLTLHSTGPHTVELGWSRLLDGLGCLQLGAVAATVPAVLATIALRGALPVGARWAAAGIGASAGALGGLFLQVHCVVGDRWHLGFVHGGLVVLAAVIAALVMPRAIERPYR